MRVYREVVIVFYQAEDGIRVLARSRGLENVYKRQVLRISIGARATTRSNVVGMWDRLAALADSQS